MGDRAGLSRFVTSALSGAFKTALPYCLLSFGLFGLAFFLLFHYSFSHIHNGFLRWSAYLLSGGFLLLVALAYAALLSITEALWRLMTLVEELAELIMQLVAQAVVEQLGALGSVDSASARRVASLAWGKTFGELRNSGGNWLSFAALAFLLSLLGWVMKAAFFGRLVSAIAEGPAAVARFAGDKLSLAALFFFRFKWKISLLRIGAHAGAGGVLLLVLLAL